MRSYEKHALITVKSGLATLKSANGYAEIPLPHNDASVFGNSGKLGIAVTDLALLASPQPVSIVFIAGAGPLADIEIYMANHIRKYAKAKNVYWSSTENDDKHPVPYEKLQQPTEKKEWSLVAPRTAAEAILSIEQGQLALSWNGNMQNHDIKRHARLTVADLRSTTDAIIKLKRILNIPNGIKVRMGRSVDQNKLSSIERNVLKEALALSNLAVSDTWVKSDDDEAFNKLMETDFMSLPALAGAGLALLIGVYSEPKASAVMAIAFAILMSGNIFIRRKRRSSRIKELSTLLQHTPS